MKLFIGISTESAGLFYRQLDEGVNDLQATATILTAAKPMRVEL
jgi:hypothetical protein